MSNPDPVQDALRRIELAWADLGTAYQDQARWDRWRDRMRYDFQTAVERLREMLTPHGDPIFVQIGASKRALQAVVIAGEHLILRGWPMRGAEVDLLIAAMVAAKQSVMERRTSDV